MEAHSYQYRTNKNRKRGVVMARLEVGSDDLWVLGTHIAAPRGAGKVRERQAKELLDVWDGRAPALVFGDLNGDPEEAELNVLREGGFSDPGQLLPPDAFTSQDGRRIDYILSTRDVAVVSLRIPAGWASDHHPVVARVRLGP